LKPKVRYVFYLPRRLAEIIETLSILFQDTQSDDPKRGAATRTLEAILQYYMESEDYQRKLVAVKNLLSQQKELKMPLFIYLTEKEQELKKRHAMDRPVSDT